MKMDRVAVLSDIHLNNKVMKQQFTRALYELFLDTPVDRLILAGDISNGVGHSISYVKALIEDLKIPVYYVPGNHDMWDRYNGLDTRDVYKLFLEDPNCLSGKIVDTPGAVLLGDIHWYDYSYADHARYSHEQFEKKMLRGSRWQDAYYIDFLKSDEYMTDYFIEEQRDLLLKAKEEYNDKPIVYTSHMINNEAFSVPSRRFELWGFFNAYLGSRKLNQFIREMKPVAAICGHVHHRRRFTEDGIDYICACLGYKKEWRYLAPDTVDLKEQIKRTLEVISLPVIKG